MSETKKGAKSPDLKAKGAIILAASTLVVSGCSSFVEHTANGQPVVELNGKDYVADNIAAIGIEDGAGLYTQPKGVEGRQEIGRLAVASGELDPTACHPNAKLGALVHDNPSHTIFPSKVETIYYTHNDLSNVGMAASDLLPCLQPSLQDKIESLGLADANVWVDGKDITSIYDPQG